MTTTQITKAQQRAAVPYELAVQIRSLLDAARKEYGPGDWDSDDVECKVFELVTEEGS